MGKSFLNKIKAKGDQINEDQKKAYSEVVNRFSYF